MASLWKHPESKFWFACFTSKEGRRLKRSTKVPNKDGNRRKAQQIADQFEDAANKRRTSKQVREVISELHEKITGEELRAVTVRSFVAEWLERKSGELAPASLDFYRKSLSRFVEFLGQQADDEMDRVTRATITRFRNHLQTTLKGRTVSNSLKAVRALYRAAREEYGVAEDPTEFVKVKKSTEQGAKRRSFGEKELRSVLGLATPEWRSMIIFALYTGQRLGDIARMTRGHVHLDRGEGGEIELRTGKTGRLMRIPLAKPLRRAIEEAPVGDNPKAPFHPAAFATVARTGRTNGLSNQFTALLAAAGLREKQVHRKKEDGAGRSGRREAGELSFHDLRRTAVTMMHEKGIPQAAVQEFVGHDSADVHQTYLAIGRPALEAAAAALPDITM